MPTTVRRLMAPRSSVGHLSNCPTALYSHRPSARLGFPLPRALITPTDGPLGPQQGLPNGRGMTKRVTAGSPSSTDQTLHDIIEATLIIMRMRSGGPLSTFRRYAGVYGWAMTTETIAAWYAGRCARQGAPILFATRTPSGHISQKSEMLSGGIYASIPPRESNPQGS